MLLMIIIITVNDNSYTWRFTDPQKANSTSVTFLQCFYFWWCVLMTLKDSQELKYLERRFLPSQSGHPLPTSDTSAANNLHNANHDLELLTVLCGKLHQLWIHCDYLISKVTTASIRPKFALCSCRYYTNTMPCEQRLLILICISTMALSYWASLMIFMISLCSGCFG